MCWNKQLQLLILALAILQTADGRARDRTGAISTDGKYFAVANKDGTVAVWDTSALRLVRILGEAIVGPEVAAVDFSLDGTLLATGHNQPTFDGIGFPLGTKSLIRLWNLPTGEKRKEFTASGRMNSFRIDPRGKDVVAAYARELVFYDLATGKILKQFSGPFAEDVLTLDFSPDGRYLLTGASENGTVAIWSLNSGSVLYSVKIGSRIVTSVRFAPSGKKFSTVGDSGDVTCWDFESGKPDLTLHHGPEALSVGVSQDSCIIATGASDSQIKLTNIATGKPGNSLSGHSASVRFVGFLRGDAHIASVSDDGTARIWSLRNGKSVSLMSKGMDWACFSPDGYFDASRSGSGLVHVVNGLEVFTMGQFALRYNRPDLLLSNTDLGTLDLVRFFEGQYQRRLRRHGFSEQMLRDDRHAPEIQIQAQHQVGRALHVSFLVTDSAHPIHSYNVNANGVPIFGQLGKRLSLKRHEIEEVVELEPGNNQIEITCVNSAGATGVSPIIASRLEQPRKHRLFYLGFGVSKYRDSSLDLNYAHKDAIDLQNVFAGMKGEFTEIVSRVTTNEGVTVKAIESAKRLLEASEIQDTVIVFIAGHGMHDKDREATYYYLTHEAKLTDLRNTAAKFELFENLLDGIPARRKLLLMDTCDSGDMDSVVFPHLRTDEKIRQLRARAIRGVSVQQQGSANARVKEFLYERDRFIVADLLRRTGAVVISSCRGGEFSYESNQIENGIFTHAVLTTLLNGAGDVYRDRGQIDANELLQSVSLIVNRKTSGMQNPTMDRENVHQRILLPVKGR